LLSNNVRLSGMIRGVDGDNNTVRQANDAFTAAGDRLVGGTDAVGAGGVFDIGLSVLYDQAIEL
jgi:hypothetical protein